MPKINKGIITYDSEDWLAGLHPQYSTSFNLQTGFSDFANMNAMNPYRYLGNLTCGRNHTAVTNASTVMTNYICQGVNNGEYGYLIERGAKLHQLNTATHTLLNDTAGVGFPHTISHGGHTGITGEDTIIYKTNVSSTLTSMCFYSFRDNTDWDIGFHNMNTTTCVFDDDFMSTVPANFATFAALIASGKSYPHPMVVGADDILYFGDRNYVHGFDGQTGADGTFYTSILTLPSEYTVIGFAKLAPKTLAIFTTTNQPSVGSSVRGKVVVWFWNYLDLDPFDIKTIDENYVTACFEYKGTIGCLCHGRSTYNKLYLFNGTSFEEATRFGGNYVEYGGVNVLGDEIQFLSGGKVYSYGNQFGLKPVLNAIEQMTYNDGASGSGFLRTFYSSSGDYVSTSTKNFQYYNDGTVDGTASPSACSFYTSYTPLGKIRVKKIRIYFAKISSGTGLTLYLGSYNGTEYEVIHELATITTQNLVVTQTRDTSGNLFPELDGLYLHGIYNGGSGTSTAPIINKIEIEYDPVEFI